MTRRSLLLGTLVLAGCAPHPRIAIPPEIASTDWREPASPAAPAAEPVGARGLAVILGSDELQGLVARALEANADIGAATARIERARAELRSARAAALPVVSASSGFSQTHSDDVGDSLFHFSQGFGGLDIGYDFDLFGQARAGRKAARARAAAARFDRDAIALAVETDVVRAYVQDRALRERIRLLDRSIADARELERIILIRLREGAATKVDSGLQTIEARRLETDRLRLVEAELKTRDALALLVGAEAPVFVLAAGDSGDLAVPSIAPVQPGALLVRRPDIRAAEARIAAAMGDVAAARAAFLPGLRFSASALGQAASLSGPTGATLAAGIGLLAPIFDRARLNGRLDTAAAGQHESVELYRKALLGALKESEDALAEIEQSARRQQLIEEVLANARTTATLSRRQYLEGESDLRALVDAERLLIQAQDAHAIAIQERLSAAADLYQAMGGSPSARP